MAASSSERGNERANSAEAEPEEKTDGWLTTYSDMVTLLLTFFVLMVAMSSTDNARIEMFLLAMSRDGITSEQFMDIQDRYNFEDVELDSWDDMWPLPGITPDEDQRTQLGMAALQQFQDDMASYLEQEGLGDILSLTFNGEYLLMTIAGDILFDTGSADIKPEMVENAKVIADTLAATWETEAPFEIVVAGHTDNVPINTQRFPSNWHLSKDRAGNFLDVLLQESHLNPAFFSIKACGEFHPVATNDTPEGRAANRRVEVMISLARENPLWNTGIEPATQPIDPLDGTLG